MSDNQFNMKKIKNYLLLFAVMCCSHSYGVMINASDSKIIFESQPWIFVESKHGGEPFQNDIYSYKVVENNNKYYFQINFSKFYINKNRVNTLVTQIKINKNTKHVLINHKNLENIDDLKYMAITYDYLKCSEKQIELSSNELMIKKYDFEIDLVKNNKNTFIKNVAMIYEIDLIKKTIKEKPNLIGKMKFDIRSECYRDAAVKDKS